ncbi:hypothetical protein llap_164 [Limosa lapponica baueri]|uniref:Uncharacterized protein n=1 Tax=Limosa lapponica baueri TaxID=1758121 RepID=A0A2I0UU77_LIMLA|nr:hypothetical protein llap_164 [Limosa lapponica baueri]
MLEEARTKWTASTPRRYPEYPCGKILRKKIDLNQKRLVYLKTVKGVTVVQRREDQKYLFYLWYLSNL